MKKLFLIPLMTLMTCVMAWGESVHTAGTFAELNSYLISGAQDGDIIQLTADIEYPKNGEGLLNITKSITLDGQGHKISGYGNGYGRPNVIGINYDNTSYVDVVIKNLNIESIEYRPLESRGYIRSLTLDNVNVKSTGGSSNSQLLTIGGVQTVEPFASVTITNSTFTDTRKTGYPILIWNPTELVISDSETSGWSALYFKPDSHGTNVLATNCKFDAPNHQSGQSNAFGAFVLEDDGIDITLDNCQVDCTIYGDQDQAVFCLSGWKEILNVDGMHLSPCEFVVKGSSTEITGNILTNDWTDTDAECPLSFLFYGGTYSDNIETKIANGIPSGFHVNALSTVKGDAPITLYRIVKDAEEKEPGVMYDLNDYVPAEGEGYGDNPISSFDLSTGAEMKLNQETTTAGYVQVSDKVNGDETTSPTIVQVGKIENPGTETETKVDQVLIINDGLDVQGESQVIVQAGSTLQIGEGGITTADPENIIIEADKEGAASLLLNPNVIVNNTPNLTVKMTAKQIGRDADNDWYWHRYAMPVDHIDMWEKQGNLVSGAAETLYPTWVYGWNYDANDWVSITPDDMLPLLGYTLTLASDYIHVDADNKVESADAAGGNLYELQDVTYIFKGNLVGNTDQALNFQHEGFNFFGNSYTGYMDALNVLNGLAAGGYVDQAIYMWDSETQTYSSVTKDKLENPTKRARLKDWQKEIAPMHTFIMILRGANSANESISYADAIWGNPRYGNNTAAPAPARDNHSGGASNVENAYMEIVVTAANGATDRIDFTEQSNMSDDYENGYDSEKYMNERHINFYSTVEGMNLSSVVTNTLLGKTLSLQTLNDVNYTISFEYVEGTEYALLDKATNTIINIDNATTYNFSAQPNSVVEGRFEIVGRHQVPTSIEDAEVSASVKGIYTLLGQYVGEDFNALPAGVYIMNGVKVVK